MQYTLLVYESPADLAKRSNPETMSAHTAMWRAYTQALVDAGVVVTGSGLQLPRTATTLRLADGKRLVQDGPFADTKEQLGGFYILDVPDLDTALDWASRCPIGPDSALEIRPNLQTPANVSEMK